MDTSTGEWVRCGKYSRGEVLRVKLYAQGKSVSWLHVTDSNMSKYDHKNTQKEKLKTMCYSKEMQLT